MVEKSVLNKLYIRDGKSMQEIAALLGCSLNTVVYWMGKYRIKTRSRSEAIYLKKNPHGDPFRFSKPKNSMDMILFGLGLGLYWGEGTKANKNTVRLGNSDPALIKSFMNFLSVIYGVNKEDLSFAIQIFSDVHSEESLDFWSRELGVMKGQFRKTIITPSRRKGTYRKKSKYGVLTVYFCNMKLRNAIMHELQKLGLKSELPM